MVKSDVRFFSFLIVTMTFMVSCGYTLVRVDPKEEDPITVIRRDLRQMKADHRVALFDLRKEQGAKIERLESDLARLKTSNEELSRVVVQMRRDFQENVVVQGQNNAELDDRFTEVELQRRKIHGRIDEEANRSKEVLEKSNQFFLKEIEVLRQSLATQVALQKKIEETVMVLGQKESEINQSLEGKIASVEARNDSLQQSSVHQGETVRGVSDQVSQLVDKLVPSVNSITTRLDDLEWQVKQFKGDGDGKTFKQRLDELTKAIEVQRKSLEKLGNTVISEVDKQSGLLQKTINRVNGLEGKTPAKGQ